MNKNLNTFLPRNRIIYGVVGSAVVLTTVLHSLTPKPKLDTDTLSPEWMAATEEYRKFQKMDQVYDISTDNVYDILDEVYDI